MTTTKAPRYIDCSMDARKKLARLFNVTDKCVDNALKYLRDNDLAKKIRYVAVKEYGGKPMRHCPECECMHIHTADGFDVMEQRFDNGAIIMANKTTGTITVTNRKGVEVARYEDAKVSKLTEAQLLAETL